MVRGRLWRCPPGLVSSSIRRVGPRAALASRRPVDLEAHRRESEYYPRSISPATAVALLAGSTSFRPTGLAAHRSAITPVAERWCTSRLRKRWREPAATGIKLFVDGGSARAGAVGTVISWGAELMATLFLGMIEPGQMWKA